MGAEWRVDNECSIVQIKRKLVRQTSRAYCLQLMNQEESTKQVQETSMKRMHENHLMNPPIDSDMLVVVPQDAPIHGLASGKFLLLAAMAANCRRDKQDDGVLGQLKLI